MKHFTVMIKPASSLCDMRCNYCFYSDVASNRHIAFTGIMSRETASSLIENVFSGLNDKDHITFAFQGGEPSLAGLEFFVFFAEKAQMETAKKAVITHYAFQTNGLLLNNEWCEFFKRFNFLIGLSLDGNIALHNQNRKDGQGNGTYTRVIDAKKRLDHYGIDYNILCVLTSETARRANRLWSFILKEKIRFIQFIPCLEPLKSKSKYALVSKKFYQFYADLFPLWKKEAQKDNMISVQLFDDLAALLLYNQRVTCGVSGGCSPQMIVESDGAVYPCDFYVLDEYKFGNLARQSLRDVFEIAINGDFLKEYRQTPEWCKGCVYYIWCQGGCKRMVNAVYGENCGMRLFLDKYLKNLLTVFAQREKAYKCTK